MALALNKILVSGTTTNTASAYLQTTTVAAVTTGNGRIDGVLHVPHVVHDVYRKAT